ncbi:MAG: hypothetical protein ACK414_09800, partial [Gemmobacter sp.]
MDATTVSGTGPLAGVLEFVALGGAAMWAIAALSVATLALILWKCWRLLCLGVWSGGRHTARALDLWAEGQGAQALALVAPRAALASALEGFEDALWADVVAGYIARLGL